MSDEQTPYTPPQAPLSGRAPAPAGSDPRGSLGAGIGLFFACLVGGGLVAWILRIAILAAVPDWTYAGPMFAIPALLPWLAALVLGLWLASRGRTRTALGILVGFGLLAAVVLLLVAACFGIVAGMGGFS
ncbi:hypothetical protein ACFONC_04865 [Luteimonas soli]|uniref:Uncharacterized protein n=1 Tax=Luteimonas soli TaxID=1648966 RepID=A0ABV7XK85_9GAMM